MSARQATPRAIRKALELLLELPPAALADLAERLVDRLDAAEPEPDLEPEPENARGVDDAPLPPLGMGDDDDAEEDNVDRCPACDDDPPAHTASGFNHPGDTADAEPDFPAPHHGSDVLGAGCWTGAT